MPGRFIVKVGTAAHNYGSTATRLESFLAGLSKKLGYPGVFRSTPSDIVFAVREGPESPQRVEIIAMQAPGVDLDKLARVGDLLNELETGTLSLADASTRLDAIDLVPPPWGRFASMLGYALVGLGLAFQTSRRDLPWAVLVSGIAYLGVMAGSSILDPNLGNLVGTIVAVVVANLWARQTGRPTSIVLIPAIVMLVSGTIGFRGLASMAEGELLLGAQQFFQMFVVALTIVTGVFVGYTIVHPEPGL